MTNTDTEKMNAREPLQNLEEALPQLSIDYKGLLSDQIEWDVVSILKLIDSLDIRTKVRIVGNTSAQKKSAEHPQRDNSSFMYMTDDEASVAEIVLNDTAIAESVTFYEEAVVDSQQFLRALNSEVSSRLIELSVRENLFRAAFNLEMFMRLNAILISSGVAVAAGAGVYLTSSEAMDGLMQLANQNSEIIDDEKKLFMISFIVCLGLTAVACSYAAKHIISMRESYRNTVNNTTGLVTTRDVVSSNKLLAVGYTLAKTIVSSPKKLVEIQTQNKSKQS